MKYILLIFIALPLALKAQQIIPAGEYDSNRFAGMFYPDHGDQDADFYKVKYSFSYINHLKDSLFINNIEKSNEYKVSFPASTAAGDTVHIEIEGAIWKHSDRIDWRSDVFSIRSNPSTWRIFRLNSILIGSNARSISVNQKGEGRATQQLNLELPAYALTINEGDVPKSFGLSSPSGHKAGTWKYFDQSTETFIDSIHSRIMALSVQDDDQYSSSFKLEARVDSAIYYPEKMGFSKAHGIVYYDLHPATTFIRAFTTEKECVLKFQTPIQNEFQSLNLKLFDKSLSWAPHGNTRLYFNDTLHYIVQPILAADANSNKANIAEIERIAGKYNVPIINVSQVYSFFSLNTSRMNQFNRNLFLSELELSSTVQLLSLYYFDEVQGSHLAISPQFYVLIDPFIALDQIKRALQNSPFEYSSTVTGSGNLIVLNYMRPIRYQLLNDLKELEKEKWCIQVEIELMGYSYEIFDLEDDSRLEVK